MLELESQLKANRLEIANREAEIKDEQSKINQYQSRLNMAPVMEQQFADITRDYDQSKTDYEALLAKEEPVGNVDRPWRKRNRASISACWILRIFR